MSLFISLKERKQNFDKFGSQILQPVLAFPVLTRYDGLIRQGEVNSLNYRRSYFVQVESIKNRPTFNEILKRNQGQVMFMDSNIIIK